MRAGSSGVPRGTVRPSSTSSTSWSTSSVPSTQADMDAVTLEATDAKNNLSRRCGASPSAWVFGREARVPTALLSEPDEVEAKQLLDDHDGLRRSQQLRLEAAKAFHDYEFSESLRRAFERVYQADRVRSVTRWPTSEPATCEGDVQGYRHGVVISIGSVWIRNSRTRLVQVAREQVRAVHTTRISRASRTRRSTWT